MGYYYWHSYKGGKPNGPGYDVVPNPGLKVINNLSCLSYPNILPYQVRIGKGECYPEVRESDDAVVEKVSRYQSRRQWQSVNSKPSCREVRRLKVNVTVWVRQLSWEDRYHAHCRHKCVQHQSRLVGYISRSLIVPVDVSVHFWVPTRFKSEQYAQRCQSLCPISQISKYKLRFHL